ncbi:MAG TPA: cytochrome c [Chloroflexota bacterium]|nr:cytochrome c [Chloroflexota bacterium]
MREPWGWGLWRAGAAGLLAVGFWVAQAGPPVRAYTPEQVTAGGEVYAASCANCHGARGEGGGRSAPDAPLVVGPRALTGFRNAQELYEFTADSMPQDAPGSLTSDQYWSVVAWLLAQNNLSEEGAPLGPDTARGISLSRR